MRVREDAIVRENGAAGIYGVVEKPDFAVILPIDNDTVFLVEQFRYPVQERYWEFPQGSLEMTPEVDPQTVARTELHEETGLVAAEMTYLGRIFGAYGYSTQGANAFLATGLSEIEKPEISEEQDLVCSHFSIERFEAMIASGEIKDATTIAAYCLYRIQTQRNTGSS